MRQDIDADAYRLKLGCRLENATGNTGTMQHQSKCQSADAGADDQDFHSKNPTVSRPGVCRPSMSYSIYRKAGMSATSAVTNSEPLIRARKRGFGAPKRGAGEAQ